MRINKLDQVFTKDNQLLGSVDSLYHRLKEVRPGWEHYATYILVQSFTLGDSFYVPTDFVAGRDSQSGHISLSVTARTAENKTWTRRPDFILHGEARKEGLAEYQQDVPVAMAKRRAGVA